VGFVKKIAAATTNGGNAAAWKSLNADHRRGRKQPEEIKQRKFEAEASPAAIPSSLAPQSSCCKHHSATLKPESTEAQTPSSPPP
jgi:hypothetical protein